jgi:hypothetical protein
MQAVKGIHRNLPDCSVNPHLAPLEKKGNIKSTAPVCEPHKPPTLRHDKKRRHSIAQFRAIPLSARAFATHPHTMPTKNALPTITRAFVLRAAILSISPQIWRRFEITANATLHDLHKTLQAVFAWWDYHLFSFTVDGRTFHCEEDDLSLTLEAIDQLGITAFHYRYDYGDNWHVVVWIEGPCKAIAPLPRLIAARRNAPPEDVGGPEGYQRYVAVLANKTGPERKEALAWRGRFDPAKVNIATIRHGLKMIGGSVAPVASTAPDTQTVCQTQYYSPYRIAEETRRQRPL